MQEKFFGNKYYYDDLFSILHCLIFKVLNFIFLGLIQYNVQSFSVFIFNLFPSLTRKGLLRKKIVVFTCRKAGTTFLKLMQRITQAW